MPEVAPSEVQQRMMSRIESTPTASPLSTTTRWRMWRLDISANHELVVLRIHWKTNRELRHAVYRAGRDHDCEPLPRQRAPLRPDPLLRPRNRQ